MKVFLTGATGFLGSALMELLIQDESIKQITFVSRKKQQHPSDKVTVIQADLTKISDLHEKVQCDFDVIYHLAGLYDFTADESLNYIQNVVGTSNLIAWIKSSDCKPKLMFASTYAIGVDQWGLNLPEKPITALPEICVTRSPYDWTVFRLGVLVGNSKTGEIRKIDGPYYNYEALKKMSPILKLTRAPIPIFANRKSFLPFVPVDTAALVMHQALNKIGMEQKIYGVYNKKSTRVETFANSLKRHFGLINKIVYTPIVNQRVAGFFGRLMSTPPDVFQYAADTPQLDNPEFEKDFHNFRVPAFKSYEKKMFEGAEQ
jgi:nucleoside-diphosphate-sugar epimerase